MANHVTTTQLADFSVMTKSVLLLLLVDFLVGDQAPERVILTNLTERDGVDFPVRGW